MELISGISNKNINSSTQWGGVGYLGNFRSSVGWVTIEFTFEGIYDVGQKGF